MQGLPKMLNDSEYIQVLNSVSNPIVVVSPVYDTGKEVIDFVVEYVNPVFNSMFSGTAFTGCLFSAIAGTIDESERLFTLGVKTVTENKSFESTYYAKRNNAWFHMIIDKTENDRCIVTLVNINELKRTEAKLTNLVYTDSLTGLPNRVHFNEVFGTIIDTAVKNNICAGIMLIDIDDMKAVNDVSGHIAGDSVLRRSARILEHFASETLRVFRLGDDEFLVLVTELASRNRMMTIADAIFESFQNGSISISAGISIAPDDNTQAADLLKYADLAMHTVKKNGKNDITFFERSMYEIFLHHTLLQEKLVIASENKAFELYYQPQFNIATNELRGFEALIRWYDSSLGWINPEEFIPIAEETHIIISLGKWVLETAIKTLRQWQTEFGFEGIMSVNVSPTQLRDVNFVNDLVQLVKQYNIKPKTLEIEITEGIFIDNIKRIVKLLNHIRNLGILVSLDDFGTGYSSFRYLQYLPLNTLKVDKAFVANLDEKMSVESSITKSIISLVTKMGIDTIAEGVERTGQLDALKSMKCHNIQGFLRGKPMDKSRCDTILNGDLSVLIRTGDEPLDRIVIKKSHC
jgi:diguanylate cyclase (GGDEF)-like protein